MVGIRIDFGNGISAYTRPFGGGVAFIERGSRGLDVPEIEIVSTEHMGDGGTVDSSRARARHLRMSIVHDRIWTREQIKKAFTPGIPRTISTPLSSMPYYVESLEFPDSLWEAQRKFTVGLVSPLAYPLGSLMSLSASTPMVYTENDYNAAGTEDRQIVGQNSNSVDVGTVFNIAAGQTLVSCGLYLKPGTDVETRELSVYTVALNRFVELVASTTIVLSPNNPGFRYYDVPVNKSFASAAQLACVCALDPTTKISLMLQPDAAYDDRWKTFREPGVSEMASILGGSYRMRDTRGVSAASTTSVYVDSNTQLPCDPKVTITLGSAAATLSISDGTHTAKISGALASGSVVVFDTSARTVTVNGVDRIAWFDRTGDWPRLYPGVSQLVSSVAGTIAVEWRPRMMGLI